MPILLLVIPVLLAVTALFLGFVGVVVYGLVSVIAFAAHPHHAHPQRL